MVVRRVFATPASLTWEERDEALEREVVIEGSGSDFTVLGAELVGPGFEIELETGRTTLHDGAERDALHVARVLEMSIEAGSGKARNPSS